MFEPRLKYYQASPKGYQALRDLQAFVDGCGLEKPLLELVKLRASQLNGCAYCIDMHWKDARAAGETEERLAMLSVWPESPAFTDRERAALSWTEAVTLISETGASDDDYADVSEQFDDRELSDLTLAIGAINVWNRMAISFRLVPGKYQPRPKD